MPTLVNAPLGRWLPPQLPYAPILMQCSCCRNNRLLQREHGSARVQHADPLRSAPWGRDEPRARGHSRPETEPVRALNSFGRYLRRSELCPAHERALEVSGLHPETIEPEAERRSGVVEGNHDHGLANIMS